MWKIAVVLICGILAVIAVIYFVVRSVVRRIKHIMQLIQRIAKGDMLVQFDDAGKDEIHAISSLLEETTLRLRTILRDLGDEAKVSVQRSQGLAAVSAEQSASMEEVMSSIN